MRTDSSEESCSLLPCLLREVLNLCAFAWLIGITFASGVLEMVELVLP